MLNLKVFGFCVIVVAIALVYGDSSGGAATAYNSAAAGNASDAISLKGNITCGKTACGEGSFAHYYSCCGANDAECCFALQMWVYIVLAVLVLIMIISTIVGIVCCCCKK